MVLLTLLRETPFEKTKLYQSYLLHKSESVGLLEQILHMLIICYTK